MKSSSVRLPDGFNDITIHNKTFTAVHQGKPYERTLPFTLDSLNAIISQLPCNGMRLPKDPVAEKLRMPPLILTFYRHVFKHRAIPTDLELANLHLNQYYNHIQNGEYIKIKESYAAENPDYTTTTVSTAGVRHRILRMYPSLIRDFHFYLLCYESGAFSEVFYSLVKDFQGYDLTVMKDDKEVLVRLMVDTQRGNYYNSLKYSRHTLEHNIFDLKINLASERKTGEFYLYNHKHIQVLVQHIHGGDSR